MPDQSVGYICLVDLSCLPHTQDLLTKEPETDASAEGEEG